MTAGRHPWYTRGVPRRQEDADDDGFGEASRYTAHLDRGWSLLDRGDLQQARNSAHQAQKIRPEVPDAAMLMAAISLAESDPDASLEWYERAIEADSEYVDAQLAAAQILLYDLDEPQRALERAEIARELDEATLADQIDFGLLEVEALLQMGDLPSARERLASLAELSTLEQLLSPGSSQEELSAALEEFIGEAFELEGDEWEPVVQRAMQLAVRVARLHIDLGAPVGAAQAALPWLDALLRTFPSDPDIWYLANEAAYVSGDGVRAAHAALQVLQLDAAQPSPDWSPEPSELHVKVVDLLLKCPDPQLRGLAREPNFVVLVNDAPPFELCLEGVDPRARVLALASRSGRELEPTLTGLALYRRNLIRLARDRLQLDREIELAVFDELAMFFNFDDARRERLGLGPIDWAESAAHGRMAESRRRELEHEDGRRKFGKPALESVAREPAAEPVVAAEPQAEENAEPAVPAVGKVESGEALPNAPAPARKKKSSQAKTAKAPSKKARASEEQARKPKRKSTGKRPSGDGHED
jgi:tetratricopeptide (TPR) repeat protein